MFDHVIFKNDSVRKLIKFILIGIVNTCFGYAVYAVLVLLGLAPQVALALSFVVGIAWNYLTHAKFVFGQGGARKIPPYIGVYLGIYVVNAVTLHYAIATGISPLVAQAILSVFAAGLSFFLISMVLTGTVPFAEFHPKNRTSGDQD